MRSDPDYGECKHSMVLTGRSGSRCVISPCTSYSDIFTKMSGAQGMFLQDDSNRRSGLGIGSSDGHAFEVLFVP